MSSDQFYFTAKKWLREGGWFFVAIILVVSAPKIIRTIYDPPEKPAKTNAEMERELWLVNQNELMEKCANLYFAEPYFSAINIDFWEEERLSEHLSLMQKIGSEMDINFHAVLAKVTPIDGNDYLSQLSFEPDNFVNVSYSLRGEAGQTYSHLNLTNHIGNEFEVTASLISREETVFHGYVQSIRKTLSVANPDCRHIKEYKKAT